MSRAGAFLAKRVVLPRAVARLAAACALCVSAAVVVVSSAQAQFSSSYLNSFPKNDIYKVHVFGGSLADGLHYGLREVFAGDTTIELTDKSSGGSGLIRQDAVDWARRAGSALDGDKPEVAVFMIGLNDRRSFWTPTTGKVPRFTDEWRSLYAARVDRVMQVFRQRKVALYWVAMPIMQGPRSTQTMRDINEIVRQRALRNGVKFIDIWRTFAGPTDEFKAFGPDLEGAVRRLRTKDGIFFTGSGYRKMAHFVQQEIRKDIELAKASRNVVLVGSAEEQKRVRPVRRTAEQKKKLQGDVSKKAAGSSAKVGRSLSLASLEQKPDHSVIEIKPSAGTGLDRGASTGPIKIKILRPAIPAAVISHVLRQSKRKGRNQIGDIVRGPLPDGLTGLSSIAPVSQFGVPGKLQIPLTQTPYYRVLVQGLSLQPKPGRADDFRWNDGQAAAFGADPDSKS